MLMGSKALLTTGYDGQVLLWNEQLSKFGTVISASNLPFTSMAFSKKKQTIYLTTLNSSVISYSLQTGKTKSVKLKKLLLTDKLLINDELNSLFVTGQSLHIEELDSDTLELKNQIPGPIDDQVTDFTITDDRASILITSASTSIVIRNLNNHNILYRDTAALILPGFSNNPTATKVEVDNKNELIFLGVANPSKVTAISKSNYNTIRIWELPNSKGCSRAPITQIKPLPYKNKALIGDSIGNLFYANYNTDNVTKFWQSQQSTVTSMETTDDNHIIVGYRNGIIEKYNTESTDPITSTQAHNGPVVGISSEIPIQEISKQTNLETETEEDPTSKCKNCEESIERLFWLCPECKELSRLYRWDSRERFRH